MLGCPMRETTLYKVITMDPRFEGFQRGQPDWHEAIGDGVVVVGIEGREFAMSVQTSRTCMCEHTTIVPKLLMEGLALQTYICTTYAGMMN